MRLKSLKLAGFKSFANPTTFSFGKNITAIVGPNGCGKSNVIDAIRWVLGETSAKQLRGGAMSDVIFAGTQTTSAKSLASVELTFEHTQDEQNGIRHELNLYHELSVRRQVNKDGKSDYFINGTRCRRRDVVDIFLGTGLGARSYAVIEQGMIGRIVDSSPMQLREFIEEGAGISRYQVRRLETQKKLNQAEENLSRLNDLRSELEKQQRTLSRQADSAKKYQQLTEQLHKLEQDIAIHQLYSAKYAELLQQKEHKTLSDLVAGVQAELGTHTAKLDKLAERITEQQWLKDDARDKLHDEQLKLQQAEHALSQHYTRIDQLAEKQVSYQKQAQDSEAQIQDLINKHKTEVAQLATLTPQLADLQTRKAEVQTRLEPLNRQWQEIHSKREELQNEQRSLEKQQALAEQANSRIAIERSKLQNRQANWQQAWDALTQESQQSQDGGINSLTVQINEHKSTLASIQRQGEDLAVHVEDQQVNFTTLKAQISEFSIALQALEKRHATLNSEYNTLHALVYPKKKEHSKPNNNQSQTKTLNLDLPKLSDTIELTALGQAHADSLDNWLAMWLDCLVESATDAHGTENLHGTENGSASENEANDRQKLLAQSKPHSQNNVILNTINSSLPLTSSHGNGELDDTLIPLTSLIKAPKLAIWQKAYLYIEENNASLGKGHKERGEGKNLAQPFAQPFAQPLANSLVNPLPTGSFILTSTGWLVGQFGMMHISKLSKNSGDSHFLRQREQQRTRLAELEEELNTVEDEIDETSRTLKKSQASHDELQTILEELTAQASNLQQQTHEHRQAITELTAKFERQNADNQRLSHDRQQLEQDKSALDEEEKQLAKQLQTLSQTLPKVNEQLAKVEEERSHIRHARSEADNQSREMDGAWQSLNLQQQQLKISVQHIEGQQNNLNKQLERYKNEQSKIIVDIEKLESELPKLEAAVKSQKNVCHEAQIKLDEYQEQLTNLQNQHAAERDAHSEERDKVANAQQRLAEVTTKLAIAKERLNEACNRLDSLGNKSASKTMTTIGQNSTQKLSNANVDDSTNLSSEMSTSKLTLLTFVPARYPIISQDYQSPYQHLWQMMIATGQDKLRFKDAVELSKALALPLGKAELEEGSELGAEPVQQQDFELTQQDTEGKTLSNLSKKLLDEFITQYAIEYSVDAGQASNDGIDSNNTKRKYDEKAEHAKQLERQKEYQVLQMQVGRLGAVNLVAVEELQQVNERLQPLSEQINDIVDSIKKLTDAIKTIDEKTKALFMQTLDSVNKDLIALFSKVFGGGQASLTLIDDDKLAKADKWRAGLELMAQPKGKKNARLAVLSGGEKTLTALSLIFAIFKQHPAPFCVLDEVDAPLDDANVGRFTGLINELANDLQFIFISHNKLTMQIADELKGITMPTAGISSLVSVSLDEAEQYIEMN